ADRAPSARAAPPIESARRPARAAREGRRRPRNVRLGRQERRRGAHSDRGRDEVDRAAGITGAIATGAETMNKALPRRSGHEGPQSSLVSFLKRSVPSVISVSSVVALFVGGAALV